MSSLAPYRFWIVIAVFVGVLLAMVLSLREPRFNAGEWRRGIPAERQSPQADATYEVERR